MVKTAGPPPAADRSKVSSRCSAATSSAEAPSAANRALCMAMQMWQPFRVAIVMISTSRAIGSSVVVSNSALALQKSFQGLWRLGEAGHRRCQRAEMADRRLHQAAGTGRRRVESVIDEHVGRHRDASGKLDNMVDDTVNVVDDSGKGFELPLLLLAGFRTLIDQLHAELAAQGHPDVRPAFGFAMQAIGFRGATSTEIGQRLGISKQAAGKTVDRLAALDTSNGPTTPATAAASSCG